MTLIELLLVLFIMATIAGLVIPVVGQNMAEMHLQGASEEFLSACRRGKAEAVGSGLVHRMNIDMSTGQYRLTVETDPLTAPGLFDTVSEGWGAIVTLPDDVVFSQVAVYPSDDVVVASAEGEAQSYIDFFPDGRATDALFILAYKEQQDLTEDQVIIGLEEATGEAAIITAAERDALDEARAAKAK